MTTIRIAHFSDTHLGYRSLAKQDPETGRNQRTVDVDRAFDRTIDSILDQHPDAIIHSGDVFHHARPTWQSLRHFIRQMRRLEVAKIPTLVIAGNHDTPRIRTGGSAYSVLELALPYVHFVADYEDQHVVNLFEHLDLHVQAIPHGALTNPDPVLSQSMPGRRNVLVCHGMAPGILEPGMHTEPGELTLAAGIVDADGFDYIALGHYHLHHQAAAHAWYSGSTERFGWGDFEATPGYVIVTLDEPGLELVVAHVPLASRPMHTLDPVHGDNLPAADLAAGILASLEALGDANAMVRVDLRDAERNVRREVERLIKRDAEKYVWSFSLTADRPLFAPGTEISGQQLAALNLQDLFAEFVKERTGSHFSAAFATAFLERGNLALTDAAIAQEMPAPEEDGAS